MTEHRKLVRMRCTSDACGQGRRGPCPTPDACRIPDDDWAELDGIWRDAGFAVLLVAVLAVVAVAVLEAHRLFG